MTATATTTTSPLSFDALLALDVQQRRQLASDTDTDAAALRMLLLFDLNRAVRLEAAWNASTEPASLKVLLDRGDDEYVRATVLRNPNIDPELLRSWDDPSETVWEAIAQNPSTPTDRLADMAGWRGEWPWDEWRYEEVLVAVAQNPSTPDEVVEELADCGNEEVQFTARERLAAGKTQ